MQTAKEPLEQLNEFGKLSAKIVKRVNDYAMETTNDFLTSSTNQLKDLSSIKKTEDSLELQKQIMTEAGAKLVNNAKKAWEMSVQNYSDINEWLESANLMKMSAINPMNPMSFNQSKPTAEKKS